MSKPLDRLTLLETFARISDRGSISAAARDLGLSQATVSRQLKELEDRFGVELAHRTTHALALTTAGKALLHDARSLLSSWDALEEEHASASGNVRGVLKVVAPVALGQLHLADIALRYQGDHPHVSMTWQLDDQPIRFSETGCDCWIRVGRIPDETLVVQPLGEVERLIVASPDLVASERIKAPQDLADLPCVALEPYEGGNIELTNRHGKRQRIAPAVRMSTNNIFALHRAALQGVGIAVLPKWFIHEDLRGGRLIDLLPHWRAATLQLNVAYQSTRYRPMRLQRFLETLRENTPRIPGIVRLRS